MRNSERAVADQVEDIVGTVEAGRFSRARRPWGGADVVISGTPPEPTGKPGFYPDPRYVVTQYDRELSWLFESLRDAFSEVIDYQSKFEFYGRLADAADRYLIAESTEPQIAKGLLLAVLDEARALAKEWPPNGDDEVKA